MAGPHTGIHLRQDGSEDNISRAKVYALIIVETLSRKKIFRLKLLPLDLQNLSCNNFNYHCILSILMLICMYLRILASSRIPWS
jgi:hypothetical protein